MAKMTKYQFIIQIVILPLMLLYGQRAQPNGNDYTMGNLIDDFQVNAPDSSANIQAFYSDVAYHNSGSFIIVWNDNRNGDYDIFGQLYSSDGSPNGENFQINDDRSDDDHSGSQCSLR